MKPEQEDQKLPTWQQGVIVKMFNELFYDHCYVEYRFIQGDFVKIVTLTRQSWAYIKNGVPVAFFCEAGTLSIDPKYVVYPDCHVCFERKGNLAEYPRIIELDEEDVKNYKGDCDWDWEEGICKTCHCSIKEIKREQRKKY